MDVDVDVTFCCVVDMSTPATTNQSFLVIADVFVDAYLDVYVCVTVFYVG